VPSSLRSGTSGLRRLQSSCHAIRAFQRAPRANGWLVLKSVVKKARIPRSSFGRSPLRRLFANSTGERLGRAAPGLGARTGGPVPSAYTAVVLDRVGGVVGAARLLGLELHEGRQRCPWHDGRSRRSLRGLNSGRALGSRDRADRFACLGRGRKQVSRFAPASPSLARREEGQRSSATCPTSNAASGGEAKRTTDLLTDGPLGGWRMSRQDSFESRPMSRSSLPSPSGSAAGSRPGSCSSRATLAAWRPRGELAERVEAVLRRPPRSLGPIALVTPLVEEAASLLPCDRSLVRDPRPEC